MDGSRFDLIARTLATATGRRGLFRAAAGVVIASGLRPDSVLGRRKRGAAQGERCSTRQCKSGLTCCYGVCVDLDSDQRHCGACARRCPDDRGCRNGKCARAGIVGSCGFGPSGRELLSCDGRCLDGDSDSRNCGGCNQRCAAGETCCLGKCRPATTTDRACGTCLSGCPSGGNCCDGQCCATGYSCCDGECVDTSRDQRNCGRCGNECTPGSMCCSDRDGVTRCTDIRTDRSNCGGCGKQIPENLRCCDGEPVDVLVNPKHCGTCGRELRKGEVCRNGIPIDLLNDRENCGSIGRSCCGDKGCRPEDPWRCCNGACTSALKPYCCEGSVVNTANDPRNCGACGVVCDQAGGASCCDGRCLTTSEDIRNCGRCGNQCGGNQYCSSGMCCQKNEQACRVDGQMKCIDVKNDPNNCGLCDRKCLNGNMCQNGQCCARTSQACSGGTCCYCETIGRRITCGNRGICEWTGYSSCP